MATKNGLVPKEVHLANAGFNKLPTNWSVVEVDELLSEDRGISVGVMYPGNHDPLGIPLIKVGDLMGNVINPNPEFRVTPEKHYEYRRTELEGGEVLLTLVGAIGQCAVVPPNMTGWNAARAVAVIRLKDPEDAKFVRLCFLSSPLKHLMQVWANTTVQATLNLKEIKQLPLPWPPKKERQAIAQILSSLDDKIELNQQMNHTLEAIARALFKSWFIDFDPVRAKMDGRQPVCMDAETAALFPAEFEDSPLGKIPNGWKISQIQDIASRVAMGPFGSRITSDNFVPSGVPVIRGNNLVNGFIEDGFVYLTQEKADELKSSVAYPGDIVFTHRGTLGQVGLIPESAAFPRYVVSQSQMLLAINREFISPQIVYYFFRSPSGQQALLANTNTTGVPSIARPSTSLKAIQMVIPTKAISERFDKLVHSLEAKREQNVQEIVSLTAIRDSLLPKLLSGQLRVG